MAKASEAKVFALRRRKRRQWLTFLRMIRYGINNFSRNAWLTVAATAVMTITLLIMFVTVSARNVLMDSLSELNKRIDISIYVKEDIPDEAIGTIKSDLSKLETVQAVKYITPEQNRENLAKSQKSSPDILNAINIATNKNPGTFRVNLVNINDTEELDKFVKTNQLLQDNLHPDLVDGGEGKAAINKIASWVGFAEKLGLLASVVFIVLSSLIVFNTIRMAIFNRKEEIQMMKLIGADRNFIRGPFIVEAIVYGFIAAVLATALGLLILLGARDGLTSFGIAVDGTIDTVVRYIGFVLLAMIASGMVIGVISSLLATRRYLKI
jgi:cell division transport system permease protein